MMASTDQAIAAVRARLDSGSFTFPLYYDDDPAPILPDVPTTFGYFTFDNEGSVLVAFGGGRGQNVYRNSAVVSIYVFAPLGYGPETTAAQAEPVAARLRSYRDNTVSIFKSDVRPLGSGSGFTVPGLSSEVSNYTCAIVEAFLTFDQIG